MPLTVAQVEAASGFAACTNAQFGCPCPASYNGKPGEACRRSCKPGHVCKRATHMRPFPEYLAQYCPPATSVMGEQPAPAPAAAESKRAAAPSTAASDGLTAVSGAMFGSGGTQGVCAFPGCGKAAPGGEGAGGGGLFCGREHERVYAQIAAASGGRAAGVQRKVHIKCFMPGCGQGFYRTEEELAQPRTFSNKF